MVRLDRIYTGGGDGGSTSLGDGTRVPKHHPRIAAFGTVDELNSTIGLALGQELPEEVAGTLRGVQNDLFDVGADLCVPLAQDGDDARGRLRVEAGYARRLEQAVDRLNADLEPLTSFVLPGGTPAAAWLHLARTVCRRAERLVSELAADEAERVNPEVLRYLNRLSDLLFVAARAANAAGHEEGAGDVLWEPGAGRPEAAGPEGAGGKE